jgi:hypothetical protein
LVEVKLMAGFAFVEFKEARDAKEAVAGTIHRVNADVRTEYVCGRSC